MSVGVPPGGATEALSPVLLPNLAVPEVLNASWVERYQASRWVRLLASFAEEFPVPTASGEIWHDWLNGSLAFPFTIFLAGSAASLVLPLVLYCCHPKLSFRGRLHLPLLVMACILTLVCLLATACVTTWTNTESISVVAWQLNHISQDVDMAAKLAGALNQSGVAVVTNLARLKTDCPPGIREYLSESVDSIVHDVNGYIAAVCALSGVLDEVPQQIDILQEQTAGVGHALARCLGFSWTLAFLSCCAIAVTVAIVEYSGSRFARRCELCDLPCLSLSCVAPAMFLVSAVAAGELAVGILSSAFCLMADETALRYAEVSLGRDSNAFNMTRYYLAGNGVNPALEDLTSAEERVGRAITWVKRYGDIIARTCPQWDDEGSSILHLETVQNSMNQTAGLLAPHHIYSYYKVVVHELVCGTAVSGVTAAALLQLFLALVCLPSLICAASCTINGLIEERSFLHGISFDPLAQDECCQETPLD